MGTLVAFPAATIDPSDKGHKDLFLIDLQGLVFHHAPSASTRHQSVNIPHRTGNPGEDQRVTKQNKLLNSRSVFVGTITTFINTPCHTMSRHVAEVYFHKTLNMLTVLALVGSKITWWKSTHFTNCESRLGPTS